MKPTHLNELLDDYGQYRNIILEEAELILKEKKRYIQTESIGTVIKLSSLDEIIDFFYFEDEHEIVEELSNMRKAIIIRQFLKGKSCDI
jgi:hypothetical protein